MRGEKSKCLLEFYDILSVTIENICKQIIPAAKFATRLAIANLRKLLDMHNTNVLTSLESCMVYYLSIPLPYSQKC